MRKYYVEVTRIDNPCSYMLQSDWFDTKEQAVEWASKLVFIDSAYRIFYMSSEWDIENDIYTDIDMDEEVSI